MVIIETTVFTKQVQSLLSADEYQQLQIHLLERPDVGSLMRGSGGLRKVRWSIAGRGKRGGVRVIYYWAVQHDTLLMLLMYAKNERDDLSREQLQVLRKLIEVEYK